MTRPLTSSQLAAEILARLTALNPAYATVGIDIGPANDERINDEPYAQIVLSRRPGMGFTLEHLYDRPVWAIDVAGDQGDYPIDAEVLALDLDLVLCAVDSSQPMFDNGLMVSFITRAGGGPAEAGLDDGERRHLLCAYIVQVQSGL